MKPGAIAISDQKITITCQPHVAIMLRRVFGGVQRRGAGSFELSATPTNAALLEWFRAQFPLDLEPGSAAPFRELVAAEKRKQLAITELEQPGYVPRAFKLALPPREYQRVAADLALRTGALLVGDAIGCGKTCTAICALIERLPAIVVTMTQLPAQWQREFAKFAPGLRVHVIETTKPYDLSRIRRERGADGKICPAPPGLPDVVAISYSKLDSWADTLAAYGRAVCFDEIQELRHSDTNKYRAASAIAGAMQLKIGASATPMFNFGSEIYPVLKVIAPDSLGTREEFYQEWCGGGGGDPSKVCVKDPVALGTYLRESGLLIRRTRKDIGRELPPLSIVRHVVECDHRRIDEAEADVAELARRVLARTGTNLERMQWAGEIDLRMRQATGIGKAPAVADFVRMLVESDETVVLFGWHRSCYDIWQSAFERAGIKYAMYTGSESVATKADGVRRFTRGEARVLIMSLRSGAGVDGLQHGCCTTVHGELDWSPKVIEQGVGRIFRDGQPNPVAAYLLVAESGSDPAIEDVLGLKDAQSSAIMDPDLAGVAQLVGSADDRIRRLAADILKRRGSQVHITPRSTIA